MKKYLILIMLMCVTNALYSQFPAKLDISSRGAKSPSPATKLGVKYRITVEGTYSMWPQFEDCHGVDAAYVYDVPKVEMDAYRWPPDTITVPIIGTKIPFVTLPHWVGDDQNYEFPPKQIMTPVLSTSFRKYTGFRIDGEPLPNSGIDRINHRYQIEKIGTGAPFQFQIIDSNFNLAQLQVIPRFEDNCGGLKVTVEEINANAPEINICDVKPVCDENGNVVGLTVDASIFVKDTTKVNDRKNILRDINPEQLGVIADGKFICSPKIVCDEKREKGLAVGILVDISGSMGGVISEVDTTMRLRASKQAINLFVDSLKTKDSTFIMTFNTSTNLNIDWTNSKPNLKTTIDGLKAEGATSVYSAVLQSLDKISTASNPNRALIVLSDGANNRDPFWSDSLFSVIKNKSLGTKIYVIALGYSNDPTDIEGRAKMEIIAKQSGGKLYDVRTSNKLDSVYKALSREIGSEECCKLMFNLPPSKDSIRFVRLVFAPLDTMIITKVINFKNACTPVKTGGIFRPNEEGVYTKPVNITSVEPNPAILNSKVRFDVNFDGDVNCKIVDMQGKITSKFALGYFTNGSYEFDINCKNTEPGSYYIILESNGITSSQKLIINK